MCAKHKRVLVADMEVYSAADLETHLSSHPCCPLCESTFYEIENMRNHQRKEHILCRYDQQVFANYDDFMTHAHSAHKVCP